MTWHLEDPLLADYVAARTDAVGSNSVEQHVVRCADCRARLNVLATDNPLLVDVWDRVQDAVHSPRPPLVERLLQRLGLTPEDALLLWASPAFRTPWLVATLLTLAFATTAATSSETRGMLLFVLVAPMLPVVGVALTYGPDADDAHEATVPTPYPALRLVLLRTIAVLATTLPITLVAGTLLPGGPGIAVAWLAPCLAAVVSTLALSTWLSVTWSATAVALAWTVGAATLAGPRSGTPSVVFEPSLLPWYAAVAVASAAVLWVRSDRLAHLGGT